MAKQKRNKQRLTVTQRIMQEATAQLTQPHDLTRKSYIKTFRYFVAYCRQNYDAKTLDECKNYIQQYSDYLQAAGYTASTAHTYLASVCSVLKIPMSDVRKPLRKTSDYTRGRTPKKYPTAKEDLYDVRWDYLVRFQAAAGIRKNELRNLKTSDFVKDESGYDCICIRCGKGGKYQLNRLLPKDVEMVKEYFSNADPDAYVFDKKYFQNNLNLHKLRSDAAKEYYSYVLHRLQTEPGYREQLLDEVEKRWNLYNLDPVTGKPKYFDRQRLTTGYYYLRGDLRRKAKEQNKPIKYDKLALLATSVFKLSHFRLDVCVHSYMLA